MGSHRRNSPPENTRYWYFTVVPAATRMGLGFVHSGNDSGLVTSGTADFGDHTPAGDNGTQT